MASNNEVVLTFAGDSEKLESAFDRVGKAADKTERKIKDTSDAVDEHGGRLNSMGEKADGAETSLIGVHDVIDGTATIMQGPGKAGVVAYIQGWADLAGGIAPLLIQMASLRLATIRQTIAQWAQNAAWLASPITWIVAGLALLVAGIVLIALKTDWFQRGWRAAWSGIKRAAGAVADWFKGPFVGFFKRTWDTLTGMPDKLKTAFEKVKDFILSPFKAAFNAIADVWNNTVGRLSFHIPDWVPKIGGNGFSMPTIPKFHTGGTVPGSPGQEMLAILQAGERVIPAGGGPAATVVIDVRGGDDEMKRLIRKWVRVDGGGDVQAAFGR